MAEPTAEGFDKGSRERCDTEVITRFDSKASKTAGMASETVICLGPRRTDDSGHFVPADLGVDVHPIYWSDALALDGMLGRLRNWSHHSTCRLM